MPLNCSQSTFGVDLLPESRVEMCISKCFKDVSIPIVAPNQRASLGPNSPCAVVKSQQDVNGNYGKSVRQRYTIVPNTLCGTARAAINADFDVKGDFSSGCRPIEANDFVRVTQGGAVTEFLCNGVDVSKTLEFNNGQPITVLFASNVDENVGRGFNIEFCQPC